MDAIERDEMGPITRWRRSLARGAVGAVIVGCALVPAAGAHAAPQTYQYSFQEHGATDSFTDTGLCDERPAEISLTYNEAFHVSATQAGLTKDEVEELLEEDDSGEITKATYTQTGDVTVTEASGITYTGHFTSWFGGAVNGDHTMVFSGVFSVNATGSDGSRISGEFHSHATFVDGEAVVDIDTGHAKGC